ncbi:Maf-like protein [Clostridium sp.]|uniref:Maf-like protein n=1 Tax=Clostridium sp. TaxID=1506 RepID=UPI003994992D
MKFILASASEHRKDLLSRIVSNFEVKISNFDEEKVEVSTNIENYVKTLAEGKAKDVALNCDNDSIIIGADTIVVIGDNILGKPKDKNHAFEMLKLLSNNVHRVYSGVAVINNQKNIMKSECLYTEVYFSEISDDEIWRYIESGECLDKAGAYGIQGYGGVFAEKINGCYYNVVGLPLNLLNKMIKNVL